jgi:hypothetical protein
MDEPTQASVGMYVNYVGMLAHGNKKVFALTNNRIAQEPANLVWREL